MIKFANSKFSFAIKGLKLVRRGERDIFFKHKIIRRNLRVREGRFNVVPWVVPYVI